MDDQKSDPLAPSISPMISTDQPDVSVTNPTHGEALPADVYNKPQTETTAIPSWTGEETSDSASESSIYPNETQASNAVYEPDNPLIPTGVAVNHNTSVVPSGTNEEVAPPAFQPSPPPPPPPGSNSTASIKPKVNPMIKWIIVVSGIIFCMLILITFGLFIFKKTPEEKAVNIVYWGLWEPDGVMQAVISDFQKANPNITVQYVFNSPKQYLAQLRDAIAQGKGPDVFRFHNSWVSMLKDELMLVPSTVMTTNEFTSTFFPVAARDLIGGSNIFGIPYMIDGLGLYYNEDLFALAGVSPPTTWQDVQNIVPKLTVRDVDGRIITSAIALGTVNNVEHFSDIMALMFMQNGANLITPTGTEAEDAVIFYHKFADSADLQSYTWNDTLDNSIYAFASKRVAMILAPSWRVFDIIQINPDLRFKIVPVPQLPGHTVTWATYWVEGVSKKSKNTDAAWKFVKYLTSKEGSAKIYSESSKSRVLFGEPYARKDLADTLTGDPYLGAYVTQAEFARSFPMASRTYDNGINDRIIKYLEDALNSYNNGTAPKAALETYSSGVEQVLSSYGLISTSKTAQ